MAVVQVPITKAKTTIEIDVDSLPADVYREAVIQGLKVMANRGASKITKETYPDETELKAAALAKAEEQVEAMKSGKIKIAGAKVAKTSGATMTEAMRLARNLVKDLMKRENIKPSRVPASEITAAAKVLIADPDNAWIMEQAKANIEERNKTKIVIDIKSLIKEDPKLVAAAEKKNAEARAKKGLSAAQAGKTAVRKKGQSAQATAH